MTETKCDHCEKATDAPLVLIGKLYDGQRRHDFCSLKCVIAWARSEPAAVPKRAPFNVLKDHFVLSAPPVVTVLFPITVSELAYQLDVKPFHLISDLMEINIFATLNQTLEENVVRKMCQKHGFAMLEEKAFA